MSRWSLLALVAAIAVLAGSYIVFSRPGPDRAAEDEVNVEAFESEGDGDGDDVVEADSGASSRSSAAPGRSGSVSKGGGRPTRVTGTNVETIDDEEMLGETVEEPMVIDDDDERGTLEVAKPESTP